MHDDIDTAVRFVVIIRTLSLFNSLHGVYFFMLLLLSADFFNIIFFKNTKRVSNGLDTDQNRLDLGPNCLQRFSADDKRQR